MFFVPSEAHPLLDKLLTWSGPFELKAKCIILNYFHYCSFQPLAFLSLLSYGPISTTTGGGDGGGGGVGVLAGVTGSGVGVGSLTGVCSHSRSVMFTPLYI